MTTSEASPRSRRIVVVLLASALAWVAPAAGADEGDGAAAPMDSSAHYVIKVTPTLTYLDVGQRDGADAGRRYAVLREQEGLLRPVGWVRVIRVYESYSIAEIGGVEAGEEIALLQRVVEQEVWDLMAPEMAALAAAQMEAKMAALAAAAAPPPPPADEEMARSWPSRSLVLLGGMDLEKDVGLTWSGSRITGRQSVRGGAIALRLAKAFARHWRWALTYRMSGEPLTAAADVTQLSIELDSHVLLRAMGKAGPYAGVGVGMHQLSWDAPPGAGGDAAYKWGFQAVGGLDIPMARGRWSLLLEGGYQRVLAWNDVIDASHARAYAGLGHNF